MVKSNSKHIFYSVLASVMIIVGFSFDNVQAQDFEEWKKNYLQEFQEFQNEYDREFYEMLQKEWEDYQSENTPNFYEKPKLENIPVIEEPVFTGPEPEKPKDGSESKSKNERPKNNQTTSETDQLKDKKSVSTSESQDDKQPKTESDQEVKLKSGPLNPSKGISTDFKPTIEKAEIHSKQLQYFGIPISYKYYAAYEKKLGKSVNKNAIAEFWKHLSTKDYPSFLDQIQQVRRQLSLNDFGYAQLLHKIGNQIYGAETNESTLFTWFMLTQSGFGTKVAYKNQKVYLLVKATPHVFRKSLTMNGTKYYDIQLSDNHPKLPKKFYTYKGKHAQKKEKPLNLLFNQLPVLQQEQKQRNLEFTFRDSTYSLSIPIDIQTVNYFKDYPQADLDLYFSSQIHNNKTHSELVNSLKPLLEDKSSLEKVNLLLRFTQRSFDYQTDTEQFNTEKKMFPVETLYYPASDCDDRAIMLGFLLDQLTDRDYIVVRYPGHLTLAVHFSDNKPSGERINDPIIYEGKHYYVSDPTYFGADAGMIMPDYQGIQPSEVFDL